MFLSLLQVGLIQTAKAKLQVESSQKVTPTAQAQMTKRTAQAQAQMAKPKVRQVFGLGQGARLNE